jgi:hypothetical protein
MNSNPHTPSQLQNLVIDHHGRADTCALKIGATTVKHAALALLSSLFIHFNSEGPNSYNPYMPESTTDIEAFTFDNLLSGEREWTLYAFFIHSALNIH